MLHSFSFITLFAQLAVAPTIHRRGCAERRPLRHDDDGPQLCRRRAQPRGRRTGPHRRRSVENRARAGDRTRQDCADCIVSVSELRNGLDVRTGRTRLVGTPADLQIQVEVPTQTNILLTSAGGQVEIEGIDGYVSGTTDFGAVHLFRLSGAVKVETKRGDVTLRESYVRGSVHTNDGRVLLEDVGGDIQGTSSRGRVVERRVDHVPTSP